METIACPHCGQIHPSSTRFCPSTGLEITKSFVCPSCGKPVEAGWQACAYCGQSLKTLNFEDNISPTFQGDKPWMLKPFPTYSIVALLLIVVVFSILVVRGFGEEEASAPT